MKVGRLVAGLTVSVALVLVGCGSSSSKPTTAAAPVHLVDFRGPGFSVGLPAKPKHVTFTVQDGRRTLRLRLNFAKAGQVAFEVGELRRTTAAAGGLTKGLLAAAGGTTTQKATTYAGFPAIDSRVVGFQGKKATLFVREVDAPKRTVLLVYILIGANLTASPPGYTAFVSSLRLR